MFYKFQGVKVHVFITCSHTHKPSHMRWQEVPCGNVSQKQSLERCSFAHKMSLPQKTWRFSGPAVHVSVVVLLQRALVVRCRGSKEPPSAAVMLPVTIPGTLPLIIHGCCVLQKFLPATNCSVDPLWPGRDPDPGVPVTPVPCFSSLPPPSLLPSSGSPGQVRGGST